MKDTDSILRVRPEFDLAREFQLAQPDFTRILGQTKDLHTALQVVVSPDLGVGRVIDELRRTAGEPRIKYRLSVGNAQAPGTYTNLISFILTGTY